MLLKNTLFRLLTLSILLLLSISTVYGKVKPLDHVLVIVDDDIVMASELEARIRTITARLKAQGTGLPPADLMAERVLDQLILESIQLQMAERNGLRVDDNQLNETMQNIAKRNGMTLDDFQEAIKSEGVTYREAREQIRRDLLLSRVQQRQVDRKVRVTDNEIETFLASSEGKSRTATEYYLGHILVSITDPANPVVVEKARKRAEAIIAELKSGEDFKQTAVAKSDGRNALQGGIIGWRKENEVPSIAADIVQTLKVGEPSELLRTSGGFHIIAVLDKRGGTEQLVKQYNVRHILIKPSEVKTEREAKENIEQLRERIISGDDFAAIAKAHSEDPISAISGGSLDWVSPGEMVPAFDDIMQNSTVGEVSQPFLSDFGWHILQVQDTRMEDLGNRIQANQARQVIHRRKYEEELSLWLREIREEAYVEFKDRTASEDDQSEDLKK
ncbi:peptidylprolyl isomerase [Alkalimarinus alittae]|uniref:Chaperone SurA n=1 Tax=Alkalimarinus alittae TaxID=2961619 RepID=A0ABY6N3M9_9ALTE|nr:peptidylprolyl isomerase [Alkalimarinus alittae]UZE96678.1 peptidylprolyl isomerase [Alkalimarinus alittae]